MDHQDLVVIHGAGNTGLPGIFILEYDATNLSIQSGSKNIPSSFILKQNYPNPFNPTTSITYDLSGTSSVKLSIYDIRGQEVKVMIDGKQPAGSYTEIWDGADNQGYLLTSGVYFYKLKVDGLEKTMKMLLVK